VRIAQCLLARCIEPIEQALAGALELTALDLAPR
jgi:hypothetical protein